MDGRSPRAHGPWWASWFGIRIGAVHAVHMLQSTDGGKSGGSPCGRRLAVDGDVDGGRWVYTPSLVIGEIVNGGRWSSGGETHVRDGVLKTLADVEGVDHEERR